VVDQDIHERMENVLRKGEELLTRHLAPRQGQSNAVSAAPFMEWHAQSTALLVSVFGPQGTFTTGFSTATRYQDTPMAVKGYVEHGMGVLRAAMEDLERGWTWTLKERVHLEVFDDFLAMAEFLIQEHGLKDPAAVLAGGVLETHLRKLCEKHDLSPDGNVSVLNDSLRKKEVYPQNEWRSVQAWYDLRTDAAHGRYENYDQQKVEQMIDGIRGFLDRHPA
jgi:hypothetical protein